MACPQFRRSRKPTAALAAELAAASVALVATGCTVVRPEATAMAVREGRSANGVTELEVELELRNPGEDEVELVQYDYTVRLSDGSSYGGRWAALRALPPGQSVTASIPALMPSSIFKTGSSAWTVSGSLSYRDPGSVARILYEAGIIKPQVGFQGAGQSVLRIPRTTVAPAPADGAASAAPSGRSSGADGASGTPGR